MKIQEKFIEYFSKFQVLSKEEKDAITKDIDIRSIKKGSTILKQGQIAKDVFFVIKGCIRQFYLYRGEEKTRNFFTKENWIFPALDRDNNNISQYYLESIEDTILVVGNNKLGNDLISQFPKIQKLSQLILEKEIIRQQKELTNYMNHTPEERYIDILKNKPELINKITQYQLASFIGVQPESLSRIRKRIFEKQKSQ